MDEALIQELLGQGGNNDALIKALRAQQARGRLGQLTGDRVIAPQGAQMIDQANRTTALIGDQRLDKAREASRQNLAQQELGLRQQEIGARASDRAFARTLAKAQLGLGYDRLAQQKELGEARLKLSASRPIKGQLSPQQAQTAADVYKAGRKGLVEGLSGTETGYIMGKLPTFTANQQKAQGSVAAMAPILKQMFRVAGEGVFTDKDQALLLEMVPTRSMEPEAREQQLALIDNIISAKLGVEPGYFTGEAAGPQAADPEPDADEDDDIDAIMNQYLGGQ